MRKKAGGAALLLAFSAVLLAGCGTGGGNAADSSDTAVSADSSDTEFFDGEDAADTEASAAVGKNFAELSFTGLDGNEYSDLFAEHKLTVLNLFATWCSPCVEEMPDLQKLNEEMSGDGVAVVGIVTDTRTDDGVDKSAVSTAQDIVESAGVTFPVLIPDETDLDGYIAQMQAFPETLFVDSQGNVIDSVTGSMSLEDWKLYVQAELENINE